MMNVNDKRKPARNLRHHSPTSAVNRHRGSRGERLLFRMGLEAEALWPLNRLLLRKTKLAWRECPVTGEPTAQTLDLLEWGRHYLKAHFVRPPSLMHRWLADELERINVEPGLKLNVLGPRGAAKSTLATLAFAMRCALEGRQPYIWIVSDTRPQAQTHLENLKAELLDNRRLAADYPDAVGRGPVWRRGAIRLRSGVAIEAFGTGQRIRGRRHRAHRPTLIICDDIQNDQHIQSAAQRQRCLGWFNAALMKAGTGRTAVINLATALHRDALALTLCRTPGWRSRVFRAVVRWPDHMDLWHAWEALYTKVENPASSDEAKAFYRRHRVEMQAGAEVLWPEEEDLYALMCLRAEGGAAAFAREKQNEPLNPDLCEWPESYFVEPLWFDDWPRHLRLKTMALDPSKGVDARRGDDSAFVMLGVDDEGLLYVEADLKRRPTPQIVADGVALYRRFQPDAFGVEANQFQHLLGESFADEFRRQSMISPRPWALNNQVNKLVRIRRLGPYLATHRLRFKTGSPSTQRLIEQLKDFPQGDHDDGPDALEMALRLAIEFLENDEPPDNLGRRLEVSG